MTPAWPRSLWVVEHADRISFALQVFPTDMPTDPARHLLAAVPGTAAVSWCSIPRAPGAVARRSNTDARTGAARTPAN